MECHLQKDELTDQLLSTIHTSHAKDLVSQGTGVFANELPEPLFQNSIHPCGRFQMSFPWECHFQIDKFTEQLCQLFSHPMQNI